MSGSLDTGDLFEHLVINDEILNYILIGLGIILHGTVALLGACSNVINLIIFSKLGLKDSMSTALLVLSISDCCVTFMQLVMCGLYAAHMAFPNSPIDFLALRFYAFSWIRCIAYLISCWITTTISIERCFCVVFPFKVREIFTRRRCLFVLAVIYISHILIHVPIFVTQKINFGVLDSPLDNETKSRDWWTVTEDRAEVEKIVNLVESLVLTVICQIIIVACAVWMTYAFRVSSRVRKIYEKDTNLRGKHYLNDSSQLTSRERKLLKIVLFLALFLTACNCPNFAVLAVYHCVPELKTPAYDTVETLMFEIADFFNTVYSSLNIVIYLTLNSNFKVAFKSMFWSAN